MMKRVICLLMALGLLLCGCAGETQSQQKIYDATFLTMFDTVTTIRGYADSEEEFQQMVEPIRRELESYHQLFDIYNDYEGIVNIKTVNDYAGEAPVVVDQRIVDLLLDCREYYELTGGKVNVAMGSVLKLWHEARNDSLDDPGNGYIPAEEDLLEAAKHTSFDTVVIDELVGSVYLADPDQSLDVGAVAKGWAVQRVAENAPEGLLISVGGNVCATGPKDSKGSAWVIGVQDPDGGETYLNTIGITRGSVVTSGDYQRCFSADGAVYHHIIDPETRYPSQYWRSVTIVCQDSGLADALSTALFVMSLEDGQALAESCGADAMWVDAQGNCHYTDGFEEMIRS